MNRFDSIGKTPLHYAVQCENFAIVDRLLGRGERERDDERLIGNTPLHDAIATCSYGGEAADRLAQIRRFRAGCS